MCATPIVHWMDIGIEENWQDAYDAPLPVFAKKYDPKVYDTERLAIFWARQQDTVLVRRNPPPAWLEHLRASNIPIPKILCANAPTARFRSSELEIIYRWCRRRPHITLQPYVVTEDAYNLSRRLQVPILGSSPAFTKDMSSKIAQRRFLAQEGIGTPRFHTFFSYHTLAEFLSQVNGDTSYVLKLPYGASGQGMLILDSPNSVSTLLRAVHKKVHANASNTALILEQWHNTRADFSYQIAFREDGSFSVSKPRAQLLCKGVFRGLRFPASMSVEDAEAVATGAARVASAFSRNGARGVVNVDGIITDTDELFPAIDVNIRFSLATYFQSYLDCLPKGRTVMVRYYDIRATRSPLELVHLVDGLERRIDEKIIIASMSDPCDRALRRIFLLFEAANLCRIEVLEEAWKLHQGSVGRGRIAHRINERN